MDKDDTCYIEVWRDPNFEGEPLRINGPAEYATLQFEDDWGDVIKSLRVGPSAFVMAYRGVNFREGMIAFGPNDEVADLRVLKFQNDLESVKVIDSLKIFDRLSFTDALAPDAAQQSTGEDTGPKPPPAKTKNRHKGGGR